MYDVASFGSLNVDLVRLNADEAVDPLADRWEWFPDPGQTVRRTSCPETLIDEPDEVHVGGKGANQAAAASRASATTGMFGKVGPDATEYGVRPTIADAGVDTEPVAVSERPTGTAFVFVESSGDSRIVVCARANGDVGEEYVDHRYDALADATVLLLQNEIPIETMEYLLQRLDAEADPPTVVFDPAPAENAQRLLRYEAVEYITPNEHEYDALSPEFDTFEGTILLTRGDDDLIVEGQTEFHVTPPTVDVVDTTGAGDVFAGYFAAEIAAGVDLRSAVEFAVDASALATRTSGAQSSIPDRDAVEQFRASLDYR